MLKFITSNKNTRKLVVEGFIFTKASDGAGGKEIWRCAERTCRARMHTGGGKLQIMRKYSSILRHQMGHGAFYGLNKK